MSRWAAFFGVDPAQRNFAMYPLVVRQFEEPYMPLYELTHGLHQVVFWVEFLLTFYFLYRVAHATSIHINFRLVLASVLNVNVTIVF